MPQVDVAINVYGKPMQTAVALLTLLQHSGQHIGRIWFIEERGQPHGARFDALLDRLGERVVFHTPIFRSGVRPVRSRWPYRIGAFRRSVRYQYAWESSARPYLFITHNDVLYTGDVIGAMLASAEGAIAVGPVGQCWNCPAFPSGRCGPERFMDFRPDHAAVIDLVKRFPTARAAHYPDVLDPRAPWPLPECRVNEWCALIDLRIAKPITMPHGPIVPFGAMHRLDIGTHWFHDVVLRGEHVRHFDIGPFARHGWAANGEGGHAALADPQRYERSEAVAADHLRQHMPHFVW